MSPRAGEAFFGNSRITNESLRGYVCPCFQSIGSVRATMTKDIESARYLVGAGRFDKAEATFAALLNVSPEDIDSLYGLGFCHLATGRHTAAL